MAGTDTLALNNWIAGAASLEHMVKNNFILDLGCPSPNSILWIHYFQCNFKVAGADLKSFSFLLFAQN